MTEFVTVRRDALRQFIYDELREQEWGVDSAEKEAKRRLAAMSVSPWQPIETIPTDANKPWDERRFWLLYAPEREGLPAMQSVCRYHDDAGWCIDELRTATHGQPLPEPPK